MRSKEEEEEEVKYLREKRAYIFTIWRVHLFTYSGLDSDQQKKKTKKSGRRKRKKKKKKKGKGKKTFAFLVPGSCVCDRVYTAVSRYTPEAKPSLFHLNIYTILYVILPESSPTRLKPA